MKLSMFKKVEKIKITLLPKKKPDKKKLGYFL